MDTMTTEALSNALTDIFDLKPGYTDQFTVALREDGKITKTEIRIDTLFTAPGHYTEAGKLLIQLTAHDAKFHDLSEFIIQWSESNLTRSVLKSMIISFEKYIKDITGILFGKEMREGMDKTSGLKEVLDKAAKLKLIDDVNSEAFMRLRAVRNLVSHGNELSDDVFKIKDNVASLFFVCLLHIVSRCANQLKEYLTGKIASEDTVPVNEEDIIKKYVGLCGDAYASYLENNVLHGEGAGISLMPVLIRETKGSENPDYDALKFLLNAPDGKYIILGVPGAGKSTLLNSYLLGVCHAFTAGESDIVPLLIKASDVAKDTSFIETLHATAAARRMDSRTVEKLLDEGRLAIAIDGINEFLPEVNAQKFLKDVMENAKGRLIMTGRIYEYASVKKTIDEFGKHRIFRIQDISSETIRRFVEKLDFDEAMSHRMLEMFKNDRILSLLNCPLNLKFLISTMLEKEDGNDFNFSNRGGLISAFFNRVRARERLDDNRAEWLLENLALHTIAKDTVSIYDFADEAMKAAPNVYDKREIVREKLIEPLVRAGILQKVNDAEIQFRLDTFREYFLARIYADSFIATSNKKKLSGRDITELPSVADDNNNETFRLMLELMDADSARNLAEELYANQCGERKTVDLTPEIYINKINYALAWICDLVRTLGTADKTKAGQPNARMLCGNWVVNNMKILLEQKKDAGPEVYGEITRAAASLCTERVIRFITGDNWLAKMIKLGLEKDTASIIAANASDARLVYRILSEILPNYRYKDHEIGAVLRDLHRKLLYGMNTLQLELLHRDIGRRIKEIESKKQSVPTEIYADYYLTALLTNNMELINAVPPKVIRNAEPSMQHGDYDRLLDSCATVDTDSSLFDFFARRTDKYKTDINLLVYVIHYLVRQKNENFAAALMSCDSFVSVVEERYYSETILRKLCALLPIQLIPKHIANKLYESSLLKIALKNAEENNFARNLKHNADEAFATIANDNLYFSTAVAKAKPDLLKCNAKLLSIDGKDRLSIVCSTLADTKAYVGAKAIIGIGTASTLEGSVEKCETFGGDYFEMVFGFRGAPAGNLRGRIDWVNSELQRKGWLEYSMCVYESNTLMLRFTSQGALNQLNKKEVREALASPLTVFRIDGKLHIPLRSVHYPKVQNGTRISIRLDNPLSINDRSYLNIATIMLRNAEGKGMPMFQQNYVDGSNKSARPLLFFGEDGTDEAMLLFGEKTVRNVCPGIWVSAQGSSYHALVKDDIVTYANVIECVDFELSCREIPTFGTFTIEKTNIAIKYILRESDGNGKYRLFLLADKTTVEAFRDIADRYPKLIFSDGNNGILQRAPEIKDHGNGILVKVSLRGAPADIKEEWTAAPTVDFNVLRSVVNECKVRSVVYPTTAIPYMRRKDGKIEIPVPVIAKYIAGMRVYLNDRSRKSLPCTLHPLSGINNFAKIMEVELKNPAGMAPAINKDRGLLFIETGSWLEYRNVLNVVQFDSGELYHPDMVRPVIEAMIQNDDTELDRTRMKFFHDSMSEHLLMLYDVTRTQLLKFKADGYQRQ